MSGLNVPAQYVKMALLKMSYMCYLVVMHTTKIEVFLCELCTKEDFVLTHQMFSQRLIPLKWSAKSCQNNLLNL